MKASTFTSLFSVSEAFTDLAQHTNKAERSRKPDLAFSEEDATSAHDNDEVIVILNY